MEKRKFPNSKAVALESKNFPYQLFSSSGQYPSITDTLGLFSRGKLAMILGQKDQIMVS